MKHLSLFINTSKPKAVEISESLIDWLEKKDFKVKNRFAVEELKDIELDLMNSVEFAICLGGDGTLLSVARKLAPLNIPILGINVGHVGFLTEIELKDLFRDLEFFKTGKFFLDKRMMIEAFVKRGDKVLSSFLALNDVVITKGPFARLIRIKATSNNSYIDTYPADGLIISTPTGSTAYSLSAGGPIVSPNMELLILTPICPHTLQNRSIVVSKDDIIKVQVFAEHQEIMLTIDGQEGFKLMPFDEVIIKKSEYYTNLIRIKNRSFFDLLRMKLKEPNGKSY
ncbi:NAD(+)/NADH kinase [Thermovenabulum sp.]|uniref:NAD(+)/NADH kinase n=1 Tax=Thermovenabulum sp. TaxID=3100335 RepID=UPI003C7D1154